MNIKIVADTNQKSLRIEKEVKNKIISEKFYRKNLVIVIGGDGFMLQTLKKNKNSNQYFYGINSGNYGFLMNKFSLKNLIKNLSNTNLISISPLEMLVKNNKNQLKLFLQLMKFLF